MAMGVMGKMLFVDVGEGTVREERLPEGWVQKVLSGLGLGVKVLYDRIPAGADPLGPENILGFVGGALTGIGAMFGGRFLVVGKSPLTGGWGDANCGGDFAPAIKGSGYDAIFFEGIAKEPVYLHIEDGQAQLHPATDLWGKDTVETEQVLKERHGSRARVACIGPAGENLVRIAGIANDRGRLAARSGLGAVMGSKKLKAVVLQGRQRTPVADREALKHWNKAVADLMPEGKNSMPAWALLPAGKLMGSLPFGFRIDGLTSLPPFRAWGTSSGNEVAIASGDAPIRNWRGDPSMYPPSAVSVRKIAPTQKKRYHCVSCPLGCGSITSMKGAYEKTHRPEYETVTAFGANLLNEDLDSLYHLNEYCNRMGIDTISTGAVVAFAIDCRQAGLLEDVPADWGDAEGIIRTVELMVTREGVGDLLAEGVRLASETIGPESRMYAFHAGGQELPMHDPRMDPAYGVLYLSDPTPGRHTITSTLEYAMFRLWTKVQDAPEPPGIYPKADKYQDSEFNAHMNAAGARFKALLDCAGLCLFGAHVGVDRMGFFEMLNAALGFDLSPDDYMQIGGSVQDLRQWFNIKHGLQPEEVDVNALIDGSVPAEKGPAKGLAYDVYAMRRRYWDAMGWDEHGRPGCDPV